VAAVVRNRRVQNIFKMSFSEQKLVVNGTNLFYKKSGNGNHVLLLCPGALGRLLVLY